MRFSICRRNAPAPASEHARASESSCSVSERSTAGAPTTGRRVREIAGLRLYPFRREVYRDDRYIALTRKQFAVLARAWDENADPFTNAVRITVSGLLA
jgi:hypothetical protein